MMNWKRFGTKRPWPYLKLYLEILVEGLRKTTETSVKIADPPGMFQILSRRAEHLATTFDVRNVKVKEGITSCFLRSTT